MNNRLSRLIKQALALLNVYPTHITGRNDFLCLLRSLHPVSTNKALIRLGPHGDGGYLVPNDLEGIEALFSPGVDVLSGFEKDCAKLGMQVYLADRSVDQREIGEVTS